MRKGKGNEKERKILRKKRERKIFSPPLHLLFPHVFFEKERKRKRERKKIRKMKEKIKLTAAHLKLIAAVTMLIDHIGAILFPGIAILRIIGRLSFPLYAFLIGEGMRKTKNKKKYFLNIFLTFLSFQFISFLVDKEFEFCVLFGFLLSILFSFVWEWSRKKWGTRYLYPILMGFLCFALTSVFPSSYSFFSFLLPLIPYFIEGKWERIGVFGLVLFFLGFFYAYQFYALFSLLFLGMYGGERGKRRGKYFFYVFYPLHYAVLGIIAWLI